MKELAQKYELGKCMEKCIYSNRYILFYFKDEELESLCQAVEKDYGFTKVGLLHYLKEQVSSVFTSYYRTINPKLTFMLDQKIGLFHDYLHLTKEESVQILAKNPFLIPASTIRIK